MKLAPELEQLARAEAEAEGIPLEEYLPSHLGAALQQRLWMQDNGSLATVTGSEATMRRIWDAPEEDEAWKHL